MKCLSPSIASEASSWADAFKRLANDRCGAGGGELITPPTHMRSAKGELDVAAVGEKTIARVAIDLQKWSDCLR
jgi:hypothetical protein